MHRTTLKMTQEIYQGSIPAKLIKGEIIFHFLQHLVYSYKYKKACGLADMTISNKKIFLMPALLKLKLHPILQKKGVL